jgi:lysophospholipase L1-like esterase
MKGILIFSDSIGFGRGESPNLGWVGRLKQDFESKGSHNCLYNLSIPGDTSTSLLKRLNTECKARIKYKHKEDKFTIIISIGMNDSKGINNKNNIKTPLPTFKKNISRIITTIKKYSKEIIIIGLTPASEEPFENTYFTNKQIETFNNVLQEYAKIENLQFIDTFKEFKKLDYLSLLSDGLHPNKKGYDKLYKIIKKKF